MILHEYGFAELYDHTTHEKEAKNVADKHPELVEELKRVLKDKSQ